MELNQKALNKTIKMRSVGDVCSVEEIVTAYLKACNEPEQARPFDASLVKPGDEVIVNGGGLAPYKFLAVTRTGLVALEDRDGDVISCCQGGCTIPPKPKNTVKVRLFKHISDTTLPTAIQEHSWQTYLNNPRWKPCSAIVEIEVTE